MKCSEVISWFITSNAVIHSVGFTSLVVLALIQFLPLLHDYVYNNISTRVKIVEQNDTVHIPTVALMIPWRGRVHLEEIATHARLFFNNQTSNCCICDQLTEHSWDVWNDLHCQDCTVKNYKRAIAVRIMKKLSSSEHDPDFEVLSARHADWNMPLVETVWDFFGCIRYLDFFTSTSDDDEDDLGSDPWCFNNHLADRYVSNKTRIEKLYGRIIEMLCGAVKLHPYNKQHCMDFINQTPQVLFRRGFLATLPLHEGVLTNLVISSTDQYSIEKISNIHDAFFLFSNPDFVSWLNYKGDLRDQILHAQDKILHRMQEIGEVDITYRVSRIVTEQRPGAKCFKMKTVAECRSHCLIPRIIHYCECVPFTLRTLAPHVLSLSEISYCNTSTYNDCRFDFEKEKQRCSAACSSPCEYVSYQWTVVRLEQHRREKAYRLNFRPVKRRYIEFAITSKETLVQFMTKAGLSLSFYLGFSGLAILSFAIFCKELATKSRTNGESVEMSAYTNFGNSGTFHDRNEHCELRDLGRQLDALEIILSNKDTALETQCTVRSGGESCRTRRTTSQKYKRLIT